MPRWIIAGKVKMKDKKISKENKIYSTINKKYSAEGTKREQMIEGVKICCV